MAIPGMAGAKDIGRAGGALPKPGPIFGKGGVLDGLFGGASTLLSGGLPLPGITGGDAHSAASSVSAPVISFGNPFTVGDGSPISDSPTSAGGSLGPASPVASGPGATAKGGGIGAGAGVDPLMLALVGGVVVVAVVMVARSK